MTLLQIVAITAISILIAIEVTWFVIELRDRRREEREREAFQRDAQRMMRDEVTRAS